MPKTTSAAVIDVGSSKICGFVASQVEGDDFNIVAQAEIKCSTFYDGKWIDEAQASQAVSSVIKQLENKTGSKLEKVFVGVPGEFTLNVTKQADAIFTAPRKISKDNVGEVFQNADRFDKPEGYSPISRSSVYFIIDDEKKVIDPISEVATKLSGLISFIFVDNNFKNLVSKAIRECGVKNFDFVAQNLAQALYLIRPDIRDGYAVLIDSGFVTTTVSVVLGDGVLYAKSFSVGSGQMADDLSQCLEIDYSDAEEILGKLNVGLQYSETDELSSSKVKVNADKANEIVRCRIEDMADSIKKCLSGCPHVLSNSMPYYVTGGAFSYVKGALTYLSQCLEKQLFAASASSPLYDKQEYTSAYALISIALSQSKPEKVGFFKKLLSSLGG